MLQPLTVKEKLAINQRMSRLTSLLYLGNYQEAKEILIDIKNSYPTSEFYTIANYYLAQIYKNQRENYPALHHIELCLQSIDDPKLHRNYREKIRLLAGILYYKVNLKEEAEQQFELLIGSEHRVVSDTAKLYAAMGAHEKGDDDNARFYLSGVSKSNLEDQEKEWYDYLLNFIGWSKIETKNIGYGDPNVSTLFAEGNRLYIGLWNGGLIVYNYILDSYSFYRAPFLGSDEVRAVYPVDNTVWIGTTNGISILNKRDDTITEHPSFEAMKVTQITGDQNTIYIGTLGNGLFAYERSSGNLKSIYSHGNISTIYVEEDVVLFATYDGRLFSLKNGIVKQIFRKRGRNPIMEIRKNGNQEFCLVTYGEGIALYQPKNKKTTYFQKKNNPMIRNDYFLTVAENNNIFYCGSLGNGVYCLENGILSPFPVSDYYLGHDIQKLLFYQGYLFIATLGEGVLIKRIF